MMSKRRILWRTGVLCSVLLVTGCAPTVARSSAPTPAITTTIPTLTPGGSTDSYTGPPPIILKDIAPGQLALSLYLTVGGRRPVGRDTTHFDTDVATHSRTRQVVAS